MQGFPEEKLFYLPRGVDVERFTPGETAAAFSRGLFRRVDRAQRRASFARSLAPAGPERRGALARRLDPRRDRSRTCRNIARAECEGARLRRRSRRNICANRRSTFSRRNAKAARRSPTKQPPAACRRSRPAKRATWWRMASQGIIVPPANVDALAEAIQHLYDHPEIVERMSVAARERVVENFTWDHFRAAAARCLRARDGDGALGRLNVLLIQLKRIGDLILTVPAIAAVRNNFSDARQSRSSPRTARANCSRRFRGSIARSRSRGRASDLASLARDRRGEV